MCVAGVCASFLAGQTVVTVPGTYATIGAAITAAHTLPQPVTIEVAPGTYFEALVVDLDGLVIKRAPSGVGDVIVQPPLGLHALEFPSSPTLTRATRVEDVTFRGQHNPNSVSLVLIQGQSPTLERCKMLDNESIFAGGVWVLPPLVPVVGPLFVDCDIAGNIADDGGGAEVEWTTRFEECWFTNNSARVRGAGIFVSSSSTSPYDVDLVDCVFSDNGQGVTPDEGGAFYTFVSNAAVRWFGCRLQNNRAKIGGAGVSNGRGVQMDHCVVIGNVATVGEAGGVLIQTGFDQFGVERPARGLFTSTKFISNTAQTRGGAVLIRRADTSPVSVPMAELFMSNCLVANNGATTGQAGGLFVERANVVCTKTTVANNNASSAGGRGIFVATSDSFVGMSTCILWGNVGNLQRNQIAGVTGAGILVAYSDVHNIGGGAYPGTGNINVSPQFLMLFGVPENSYFLLGSSPCINTGDPAVSLDGSESVLSGLSPDVPAPDMGYHRNAVPQAPVVFP